MKFSKTKKVVLFAFFAFIITLILSVNIFAYNYGYYDDYYYDNDYDYDESYTVYENELSDANKFDLKKNLLISILVGVVIALISVGVMCSKMKSVRAVHTAGNYIKYGSMNITRRHDIYLYSTVTKIPKPQDNKRK